jgi:acyl-CoA thioester hydrolase
MPYSELEQEGIDLVVTRVEARYRRAARYDDEVQVWTRIREARSRRCVFEYRVQRRRDGALLADGLTVHVAIRRSTGRPARVPDRFLTRYRAAAEEAAED